jgi:respiratory burst oxidase
MKDSKEFANELFDAFLRRKGKKVQLLSKDELYEYWLQISDKSFDSRIQIFFDL